MLYPLSYEGGTCAIACGKPSRCSPGACIQPEEESRGLSRGRLGRLASGRRRRRWRLGIRWRAFGRARGLSVGSGDVGFHAADRTHSRVRQTDPQLSAFSL